MSLLHCIEEEGRAVLASVVFGDQLREASQVGLALLADVDILAFDILDEFFWHSFWKSKKSIGWLYNAYVHIISGDKL